MGQRSRGYVFRVPSFVDPHSHVVPSGDDGAQTVEEGRVLCREAARRGTGILFATPHVWPHLPATPEREERVSAAVAAVAADARLELRLGWELTPSEALLADDLARYRLEGTDVVLMEVPFTGDHSLVERLAERAQAAGLRPLIAHPERSEAALLDAGLALALAWRWPVQVNATSLLGQHGPVAKAIAWRLVDEGAVAAIGSDGHRRGRPPHLDSAYAAVRARIGVAADALFDGSALLARAGAVTAATDSGRRLRRAAGF